MKKTLDKTKALPKTWKEVFTFLKASDFHFSAKEFQDAVRSARRSDPWYLQLFIFVSALMSASAFLGLLANLGVFAHMELTSFLGVVLLLLSLAINTFCADKIAKSGIVLSHIGIFLHLNAKVLLIVALTQWFENFLPLNAAFLSAFYVLEWLLLFLYRNVVTYLLAFPLLAGLTVAFGESTWFLDTLPYLLLLLSAFAVSFFLWEWRLPYRYFHAYRPLALGAMLAMQFLVLWSWQLPEVMYPLLTSLLWLLLVGIVIWFLAGWYDAKLYMRLGFLLFALFIAAVAPLGVVSSGLFILLAFHTGYRLLLAFSFLALVLQTFFWLWFLAGSFEIKLLMLAALGFFFLSIAWLVARRCCFR